MKKLKNLLSDDFKGIRHRRLVLTIQITILSWLVELLATMVALLVLLIGVDNKMGEFIMEELARFVYVIALPSIIVIRDSELKDNILESPLYISILQKIGWTYNGPLRESNPNDENQPADSAASDKDESNNFGNNEYLQDLSCQFVGSLRSKYKEEANGLNVNNMEEGHCEKKYRLGKKPGFNKKKIKKS